MASFVTESEEKKLFQSFLPSPSQLRISALGKSRDTAICIPSDIDSDTEDEDNASQEPDGSQSSRHDSIIDFLDLTAVESGAIESDATIGAKPASAVSLTQGDTAPAWPNEPAESSLAEVELSQQFHETNYLLVENTPTESQESHFETPPTSPESQPYRFAVNRKQLQPEPAIHQEKIRFDAVSAYDVCDSSHRRRDSPSVGAQSPRTVRPIEVAQVSLQENEIPAGKSCDDAIPEIRIPSRGMSSDEPDPKTSPV